ncbi:hypothetical protein Q31b_06210 [Novipirellula aureliae]|uniref:SLA1 homology domain-containing protein n=2 Tax=Novipirellula aureliae TaxID=2527966 RepID=A0A5C6EDZ9_9BACT|nr:hypothetical protein Q31b_06210 [Novipirellula aureliae]
MSLFVVIGFCGEFLFAQYLPGVPVKLFPASGEEVEVNYGGKWCPGVVIRADKEEATALVEYTSSGRQNEREFDIEKVRYPWQPLVISPVYVWKDSTGEHTIVAAVESIDEKTNHVTLIRRDDGRMITLPIDRLGATEQQRIRLLIRAAPVRVARLPPIEPFAPTQQLAGSSLGATSSLAELPPDPPSIPVAVPMGGASFARAYSDETLGGVFPIGSSRGWILGATLPKRYSSKSDVPTRLIWATLDDGKIACQHLLAPQERTIAVHARSQQVLSLGEADDDVATLTVWKSSPKLKEAEAVVRWASGEHPSHNPVNRWGEFIDGRTVLHRLGKGEYAAYDFVAKQTLYKFGQDSRTSPEPVLSPGHRILAIPEGRSVRLVKPTSGEVLASLPVEGGSASSVAFDADGERLAILSANEMAVWTLGTSQPPRRVRADLLMSSSRLAWVDDGHLLVGGSTLFSLDQELPVWSYRPQGEVVRDRDEPNTVAIADSRLCYGVQIGNRYDRTNPGGLVIGAVELPGPIVRETVAGMNREELFVLKPDVGVDMKVECGQYNDRVRQNLTELIEENQWQYLPGAPIVLRGIMSRDAPEEMIYIKSNSPMGFGGMSIFGPTREQLANAERLTRQSYRSTLRVERGEQRLFGAASVGALPSSLRLKEGQTVASIRAQYEKPVPEFFETVKVPAKIYDPRYQGGFGVSHYGSKGLVPKPLDDLPN